MADAPPWTFSCRDTPDVWVGTVAPLDQDLYGTSTEYWARGEECSASDSRWRVGTLHNPHTDPHTDPHTPSLSARGCCFMGWEDLPCTPSHKPYSAASRATP